MDDLNEDLSDIIKDEYLYKIKYNMIKLAKTKLVFKKCLEKFNSTLEKNGIDTIAHSNENVKKNNKVLLDFVENPDKNIMLPTVNKIYKNFCLRYHPDKNPDGIDIFLKSQKYANNNNLIKLILLCDKLKLNIPKLSDDDLKLIDKNILEIENKNNHFQNTFAWNWYHHTYNKS